VKLKRNESRQMSTPTCRRRAHVRREARGEPSRAGGRGGRDRDRALEQRRDLHEGRDSRGPAPAFLVARVQRLPRVGQVRDLAQQVPREPCVKRAVLLRIHPPLLRRRDAPLLPPHRGRAPLLPCPLRSCPVPASHCVCPAPRRLSARWQCARATCTLPANDAPRPPPQPAPRRFCLVNPCSTAATCSSHSTSSVLVSGIGVVRPARAFRNHALALGLHLFRGSAAL